MTLQEIEARIQQNIATGNLNLSALTAGLPARDEQISCVEKLFSLDDFGLPDAKLLTEENSVTLFVEHVTLLNAHDVTFYLIFTEYGDSLEVTLRLASTSKIQLPSLQQVLKSLSGEAAAPALPAGLDDITRLGLSVVELSFNTGLKIFTRAAVKISSAEPWHPPDMPKFSMETTLDLRLVKPTLADERKISGELTGILKAPGIEGIYFVASLQNDFKLDGGARNINLAKIAEYFELPLPPELPDITGSIGFSVTPKQKSFMLWGELEVGWQMGKTPLNTFVGLSLTSQPAAAGANPLGRQIVTGSFNFKATSQISLVEGVELKEFALGFAREAEKDWSANGGLTLSLFEKDFKLTAAYKTEAERTKLILATSDESKDVQIQVPGLEGVTLKSFEFYLELLNPKPTRLLPEKGKRKRRGRLAAERNFKGNVTVALTLPGVENIALKAALEDDLALAIKDLKMNLAGIANGLGIELPKEVPDVTSEINLEIKRLSATKNWEFKLDGNTEVDWAFDTGALKTKTTYQLQRKQTQNSAALLTGFFDFTAVNTFSFLPELKVNQFGLRFERKEQQSWDADGEIALEVFKRPVQLKAGYQQDKDKKRLKLSTSAAGDLFTLEGIATLKAAAFALEIEKEAGQKLNWDVVAASNLEVKDVFTLSCVLKLYRHDQSIGLRLEPETSAPLIIPLVPEEIKAVALKFSPGAIEIKRDAEMWNFEASAKLSLVGLPSGSLLPVETEALLRINSKAVALIVEHPLPAFEGALPDIVLPDLPPIPLSQLGKTKIQVAGIAATLSKQSSLTAALDVALPEDLNYIFGEKPGSREAGQREPAVKIFKTYPEAVQFEFGLGYDGKSFGILFRLNSSPIAAIEIKDGVWKCDLGQFGAIDIEIPTFKFDGKDFGAKMGFKIARELRLPLVPLKELLKRSGEKVAAELLPDSVGLTDIQIIKDEKLQIAPLVALLETAFHTEVAQPIKDALAKLESLVEKLPEELVKYLEFSVPQQFHLEVSVNAAGRVNVEVNVDQDHPLRLLFPGMLGPIPALQGVTLYGFSVGTLIPGALFTLSIDAVFDQFDLASLIAGVTIPPNEFLTPSRKIHRRLLLRDLFTLVVFVEGIPIPVPLFYSELGLDSLGLEGVELQAHVKFPMPKPDLLELLRLVSALREFFTKPERRLLPADIPEHANLVFTLENVYVQLPKYLGGGLLGKKGELVRIDFLAEIARLLNGVKFLTLKELIQVIDLKYRVESVDVSFLALKMRAAWLLTTPQEFRDGAYQRIELPPEQVNNYLQLLRGGGQEDGVVVFFKGIWTLDDVARLNSSFGLITTGSAGFATGFQLDGKIRDVIDLNLKGAVSLVRAQSPGESSRFELQGYCYLKFLDLEVFKGEVSVKAEANYFYLAGDFTLFKDRAFTVAGQIQGRLDEHGIEVNGFVAARLGPVVLTEAQAIIDNNHAHVAARWLGVAIDFTAQRDGARYFTAFEANLGELGTLKAEIEPGSYVRIGARIAGLYDVQINSQTVAGEVVGAQLLIKQWDMVLVEGSSESHPDSFALTGAFHLFPPGAPLNIIATVKGELKPANFYLEGNIETMTILTGVLTGGRIKIAVTGIMLTGALLGADIGEVAIREENGQIAIKFDANLAGVFRLSNKLLISKDGARGTDIIEGGIGDLALNASLSLPEFAGSCSLSLLGQHIFDGSISLAPGQFNIGGGLTLSLPPLMELQARLDGQINAQGLRLTGQGDFKSWIPLVPWGSASIRIEEGNLTAAVSLDFAWPIGRVGATASFRVWRGQPCFMLAYILGACIFGRCLDKNHLAVSPNGIVSIGLGWETFPDDWPRDLIPQSLNLMGDALKFDPEEAMPLPDLMRMFARYDWANAQTQPQLNGANAKRALQTFAQYQLNLEILKQPEAPAEDFQIQLTAHNVGGTTPLFSELKTELEMMIQSDEKFSARLGERRLEDLIKLERARFVFSTTAREIENAQAQMTIEYQTATESRALPVQYSFAEGVGKSDYEQLAHAILDS